MSKILNSISWPSPFKEIILQEAEYAGLMTAYHSYLVTNLDLQLVNMEVFLILFIMCIITILFIATALTVIRPWYCSMICTVFYRRVRSAVKSIKNN